MKITTHPILQRSRMVIALAAGASISLAVVSFSVANAPTSSAAANLHHGLDRASVATKGVFSDLLASAINVDVAHDAVTLPLYEGVSNGKPTWYVITDTSSRAYAKKFGANFSGKLQNAVGTAAVQQGEWHGSTLSFAGTVNFGLKHVLIPGPNGFPPAKFAPGAVGDAAYSPLVGVSEGTGTAAHEVVINAPQVANATGLSGSVVSINKTKHWVKLSLLAGFVDGQNTLYLHTDASTTLVAALEDSTYAPNLNASPGLASDAPTGTRAAIIPVVNGPRGESNPSRQGLQSALLGQGDPLNVAQEQPSDPVHYTPVWDVTPVQWTAKAIRSGKRVQLTSWQQVAAEAVAGNVTSALPGTPDKGIGGINSSGAISNCPIVVTFPG